MECSPYFAATGTHPILPIDIIEANYLLPPPEMPLTSTDLIACQAITLQKRCAQLTNLQAKVYAVHVQAKTRFKKEHLRNVEDFNFKPGDLVLVRNTAIEKSLNRKMCTHYLGPLIVLAQERGGAYIVAELDSSVFDWPAAAFRIIPYFACKNIHLPPLQELLDISNCHLQEHKDSEVSDSDKEDGDSISEDALNGQSQLWPNYGGTFQPGAHHAKILAFILIYLPIPYSTLNNYLWLIVINHNTRVLFMSTKYCHLNHVWI